MKVQPSSIRRAHGQQRGVATLAVVMVLFFVIAMTAAYTSRNMIFEQKTSANQYRSTLAFEAAEAGIEWTLAQLNGGLINDNCGAGSPTVSFEQRYLRIDPVTARAQNPRALTPSTNQLPPGRWPACVFDGSSWNNEAHCVCPDATEMTPGAVTGNEVSPAFRVWFGFPAPPNQPSLPPPPEARPGVVSLQVNSCTRLPAGGQDCLALSPQGDAGDGMASLRVLLALRSGLATPPAAAVTAREGVTADDVPATKPKLQVVNVDPRTNGITVNAGGAANETQIAALTLAGVPGETTVVDADSRLFDLTNNQAAGGLSASERMFVAQFGMRRQTYLEQPGLRRCPTPGATTCTAADISALLAQNPGRIIWVQGDLTLDADLGIPANPATGAPAIPVLLVVDGTTLTLGNGADITGFVYVTGRTVAGGASPVTVNLPDSPTSITGALVSETSLTTAYTGTPAAASILTVTYDPAVLNTLRTGYGSWVRVPGSWRDFRE